MTDSDVREKELLDDDYQSEVMLWPEYLSYTYDLAGRRVGMRGSLATTQLPRRFPRQLTMRTTSLRSGDQPQ